MALQILVEDIEVFARINFIRDQIHLGESTREETWKEMKELYLQEAESCVEHYVLTLDEIKEIQKALKR
jgi:hypothetical protein